MSLVYTKEKHIMKRLIIFILIIIAGAIIYLVLSKTNILKRNFLPADKISLTESSKTLLEDIPLVSVVADNLSVPWALAFLPDNRLLVTERNGAIKLIDGETISTIKKINVRQDGESGLHGIAVDPEFASNNYIYVYYTYQVNGQNTVNRVSRFRFFDDILTDETILVDNIPGGRIHDGGRIKFGPDGYLYITTGDAAKPSLSQDTTSLAGKILRVDRNGTFAPDNPFGSAVYSYGHRNPQGIAWDSKNQLFETEHGSSAADEFNKIERGGNYGWPVITGDQTGTNMIAPLLQSGSKTWAPAGLAYVNGKFYFGGLRGSALFEAEQVNGKFKLTEHFKGEFGRIREVIIGRDNMLYITTSNRDGRGIPSNGDDKILRINPEKLE